MFMEFDLADFSNTNKEQKTLAEIRRDSFTEGFMKGKEEAVTEIQNKMLEIYEKGCEGVNCDECECYKYSIDACSDMFIRKQIDSMFSKIKRMKKNG